MNHILSLNSSRRSAALIAVVLTSAMLTGCASTPPVKSDSLSTSGLERCHSFSWDTREGRATEADRAFANPVNERRLRDAVAAQLASRGITPAAEGAAPDCLVSTVIGSRQTVEADPMPMRWGFGLGFGQPRFMGSLGWSSDSLYAYREGRISVDVFAAPAHDPLWHAYVETDVGSLTGERAQERINKAVAAIFTHYPGH